MVAAVADRTYIDADYFYVVYAYEQSLLNAAKVGFNRAPRCGLDIGG